MSRTARMALDLALVSMRTVQPYVAKFWVFAKTSVAKTPAKFLVCNQIVNKAENKLEQFTEVMYAKMSALRDQQMASEVKYLEKEIERIKQRMAGGQQTKEETFADMIKPKLSTAWQYAKVECAPPNTINFLQGAGGQALEKSVGGVVDGVIESMRNAIKQMDAAALKKIQDQENAIKAQLEKQKAEAKKKEEELKKQDAEKKAAEAKAAADKAAKKKEAEAKSDSKSETKKAAPKKEPPKKKPPVQKPKPKKK